MKRTACIFLVNILGLLLNAQDTETLLSLWNDPAQTNDIRVNAYENLIYQKYLFSNPDTADKLAEALQPFAQNQQFPRASAVGFNLQGIANAILGNYSRALEYYQLSLEIDEELDNIGGVEASLSNIGNIYADQGNYPRALEYYQKSLAIAEDLGYKSNIASSLGNIGSIYKDIGDYSRALEYYQKSLSFQEEIVRQDSSKAENKNAMANNFSNIGLIYAQQGDLSKSLEYHNKSLALNQEFGDKLGIASSLGNIGTVYADQGDYPRALDYFKRDLALQKELGNKNGIAITMINMGTLFNIQGNSLFAIDICKESLEISEEIEALDPQMGACECLFVAYKALGKGMMALKFFEQMVAIRDRIYNEENTKSLTRLEMQYEFDKKEAEALAEQEKKDAIALQELKRQKLVRNGFIGGFSIVLLFASVFFVQRNRIGMEKQRSEELLLNILPEETAEELKAKGHSDAKLIDQVTVLFTDFKGFTALSEKVTPKELVSDLHACFSEFDRICEKYGIEKIKTIGDAYMAAGGLPTPNQTHGKDVVKAALEMAEVVEKGKAKKISQGLPFFEIRVGIHTGPVVAGIVGIKKFQYDIWGDTVNTAARMESSGEVGMVNISKTTFELLKDDADLAFESRGKIAAKGKGKVEMYFVSKKGKE
jgi:adenylate cyclase